MTSPWVPTPADQIMAPEEMLALFPDNTTGAIGAGDLRTLVQNLASTLYWHNEAIADLQEPPA